MSIEIRSDVDPQTLAEQIGSALGQDVALTVRQPGQEDDSGNTLPGVVIVLDLDGLPLYLDGSQLALVEATIEKHVVPEPRKTAMEELADAAEGATTMADLQAAILAFAQANVPQRR